MICRNFRFSYSARGNFQFFWIFCEGVSKTCFILSSSSEPLKTKLTDGFKSVSSTVGGCSAKTMEKFPIDSVHLR